MKRSCPAAVRPYQPIVFRFPLHWNVDLFPSAFFRLANIHLICSRRGGIYSYLDAAPAPAAAVVVVELLYPIQRWSPPPRCKFQRVGHQLSSILLLLIVVHCCR